MSFRVLPPQPNNIKATTLFLGNCTLIPLIYTTTSDGLIIIVIIGDLLWKNGLFAINLLFNLEIDA